MVSVLQRNQIGVKLMRLITKFLKDESGMETLEYAVIAGLIALVAVAIYATSGTWKATLQNRLENAAAQNLVKHVVCARKG